MDPDIVRALLIALAEEQVEYVLIGALALDALGIGRLTDDIDFFVRPTEENLERLRRALHRTWQDPSIEEIQASDLAGEYPAVQYIAPDGTRIDILARLGEAFSFDDLVADTIPYGDCEARVATPATLYEMKRATVRLQDRVDAEKLKEKFHLND